MVHISIHIAMIQCKQGCCLIMGFSRNDVIMKVLPDELRIPESNNFIPIELHQVHNTKRT